MIGEGLLTQHHQSSVNQDGEAMNLNVAEVDEDQMSHTSDEMEEMESISDPRSSRYFFRQGGGGNIAQSGTIDLASILPSIRGSILR